MGAATYIQYGTHAESIGAPGSAAGSKIRAWGTNNVPTISDFSIGVDAGQFWHNCAGTARHSFTTAGTERFSLDATTAAFNGDLDVGGAASIGASNAITFHNSAGVINSAAGNKLVLFTTGTNYVIGVASSTLYYNVPTGGKHSFNVNEVEVANVTNTGLTVTGLTVTGDLAVTGTVRSGNNFIDEQLLTGYINSSFTMTNPGTSYAAITNTTFVALGTKVKVTGKGSGLVTGGTGGDWGYMYLVLKTGGTYVNGWHITNAYYNVGRVNAGLTPLDDFYTVTKGTTYTLSLRFDTYGDDILSYGADALCVTHYT
jgi:hypothetical protein